MSIALDEFDRRIDVGEETNCPECGSRVLERDYRHGELVCSGCDLVIEDRLMDPGPEWRAFNAEQREKRNRVGAPTTETMHDRGLYTMIDHRDRDIYGNNIKPETRTRMRRLRKWDKRSKVQDSKDRNLSFALNEIDRISSQLHLPRYVKERGAFLYRQTVENNLLRGRSIEDVAAGAVYASCRQSGIPRTLDEIADVTKCDRKDVGRAFRLLTQKLNIKVAPPNALEYIPRFACELGVNDSVSMKAVRMAEEVVKRGLSSGKSPQGIAASVLYMASVLEDGKGVTQKAVAEVADVTEVTIRNRYKEIAENMGIDV